MPLRPPRRARPKSISLGCHRPESSRARKMFSGFTSRWSMPRAWRAPSAPTMGSSVRTATTGSRKPSRPSVSARASPSRSSITRKGSPLPVRPTSKMRRMPGWSSLAAARASTSSRSAASGSAPSSRSSLSATCASSPTLWATQTTPMPPSSSLRRSWYLPSRISPGASEVIERRACAGPPSTGASVTRGAAGAPSVAIAGVYHERARAAARTSEQRIRRVSSRGSRVTARGITALGVAAMARK